MVKKLAFLAVVCGLPLIMASPRPPGLSSDAMAEQALAITLGKHPSALRGCLKACSRDCEGCEPAAFQGIFSPAARLRTSF